MRHARSLGVAPGYTGILAEVIVANYASAYPELEEKREHIIAELSQEEQRFEKTLAAGEREFEKTAAALVQHGQTRISGRTAFKLYDTYGFPLEFTEELARERGLTVDRAGYEEAFRKHQELSKQGEGAFKGGLADHSELTTALHTATHLLHRALKNVLGEHVNQKGSNITAERLRFDFSHSDKMTPEQIQQVETMVNEVIRADLPVTMEVMSLEAARTAGATALFAGKYDEMVKVYTVGDFSKEVCGGPHVARTGQLGRFRILK